MNKTRMIQLSVAALILIAFLVSLSAVQLPRANRANLSEYLRSERTYFTVPNPVGTSLDAYHRSERTHTPISGLAETDLAAYHSSERTYVNFTTSDELDLTNYHLSEWNSILIPVVGPNGLEAYQKSEHTYVPMRNLDAFSAYQRSEWFSR